jgi:hypothetical protein
VVDLDRARELTERALELALSSADRPAIRRALVGIADYLRRAGEPLRAAAVLGASADNRGRPSQGLAAATQIVQAVQDALTEADYAEAFARGRATPLDELPQLAGLAPLPESVGR